MAIPDDDRRWSIVTPPTTWTAAHTIEHIADALLFYAGQVACRADIRMPFVRDGRAAPPSGQLSNVRSSTAILAATLRDLGGERAWHSSGHADAAGWCGMAVTELLVHGYDAATATGLPLPLPANVCARTLARVFPWVSAWNADPGLALLAATGRGAVNGWTAPADWWWQSAHSTSGVVNSATAVPHLAGGSPRLASCSHVAGATSRHCTVSYATHEPALADRQAR